MLKWGLASASIRECGTLYQTVARVILECLVHRAPVDKKSNFCYAYL